MKNPTTIKEQWEDYRKQCIHGNAPLHGFELMYYLGAGAVLNVLVTMRKEPSEEKQIKMLEKMNEEIQKRLDELTK